MRTLIFLSLALVSITAQAQVYKCTEKYGRTIYQNTPCSTSAKEQQLDIKSKLDPAEEAEAKAKLEAIRSEYDARKAAQEEKDKELRAQRAEAASLEAARRAATAQQQQALAQQRQADAVERQNQELSRQPYLMIPPGASPNSAVPVVPQQRPLPGATIR